MVSLNELFSGDHCLVLIEILGVFNSETTLNNSSRPKIFLKNFDKSKFNKLIHERIQFLEIFHSRIFYFIKLRIVLDSFFLNWL